MQKQIAQPKKETTTSVSNEQHQTTDPSKQTVYTAHTAPAEQRTSPKKHATTAYDVRGLRSPYPGLCWYRYSQRHCYAGREALVASAVNTYAQPHHICPLIWVVGDSGVGKSSFALAGLLPALETHYTAHNREPRSATMRPSIKPLDNLLTALTHLGMPAHTLSSHAIADDPLMVCRFLEQTTAVHHINVLVIDQAEQLFTQAEAPQRDAFLMWLNTLYTSKTGRIQLILPIQTRYYEQAMMHIAQQQALIEPHLEPLLLPIMNEDEIRAAIVRPLETTYAGKQKQFDETLLTSLAQDAAQLATQQPAALAQLQVTLQRIWQSGSLQAQTYAPLERAIEHYAEDVYTYGDYLEAQTIKRPLSSQQAIMQLLLALIVPPPNSGNSNNSNDELPTARCIRRRAADLYTLDVAPRARVRRGHHDDTRELCSRLIEELCRANVLHKDEERRGNETVEILEITNEHLLVHWKRLRDTLANSANIVTTDVSTTQQPSQRATPSSSHTTIAYQQQQSLTTAATGYTPMNNQQNELNDEYFPLATVQERANEQRIRHDVFLQRRRQVVKQLALKSAVALLILATLGMVWHYATITTPTTRHVMPSSPHHSATTTTSSAQNVSADALVLQTEMALQQSTADVLQQQAAMQQDALLSRSLLLAAQETLPTDAELAMLLTIEAARRDRSNDVEKMLHHVMTSMPIRAILHGHRAPVWYAEFSPDGQRIVTASDDTTARVWDAITGQELLVLRGHTAAVLFAAFSPDGQRVVTTSDDTTARVWDANSGKELLLIRDGDETDETNEGGRINMACFSPDGTHIVLASETSTGRIIRVEDGVVERVLGGATGTRVIAYSPDGKWLVTVGLNQRVQLWNSDTAQLQLTLHGHTDVVWSAHFSPDSQSLLTTSADNTIRVWQVTTGAIKQKIDGVAVRDAAWHPDGIHIVTAGWDAVVRVWDVPTGTEIVQLPGHTAVVMSVAYSPDGLRIVSASSDSNVRVWDNQTYAEHLALTSHAERITAVAYSPDGQFIATGDSNATAYIWQVQTGALYQELRGAHSGSINDVAFSPDGQRLITVGNDGVGWVWNVQNGNRRQVLRGHTKAILSVAYSPDGLHIVTASQDQTIRMWNEQTGAEELVLQGHEGGVHDVCFTPDGTHVVSVSADDTIRLWQVATGEQQAIWHANGGGINSIALHPNGEHVVTTSNDSTATIWELATGKPIITLQAHTAPLHDACYTPDGTRIVTVSSDATTRVWDAIQGTELFQLGDANNTGSRVSRVAVNPTGHTIATASDDGIARLYYAAFDDILAVAQRTTTRTLTDEERATYLIQE